MKDGPPAIAPKVRVWPWACFGALALCGGLGVLLVRALRPIASRQLAFARWEHDAEGRRTDVTHLVLLEVADDPKLPADVRREAGLLLCVRVNTVIGELETPREVRTRRLLSGEVPGPYDRDETCVSAWLLLLTGGPTDDGVAVDDWCAKQMLAELGVPAPQGPAEARAWIARRRGHDESVRDELELLCDTTTRGATSAEVQRRSARRKPPPRLPLPRDPR